MSQFTEDEKNRLKHMWSSASVKIFNKFNEVGSYKVLPILKALEHLKNVMIILDDPENKEDK